MRSSNTTQLGFISRKVAIVIAVVLVAIAVGMYFSLHKSTTQREASTNPTGYETTAAAFVKAISQNDGQTSWNLMSSAFQVKTGSEQIWQKQVTTSFGSETGSPKFVSATSQPDQYKVYGGSSPYRVTYDFMFHNNKKTEKWQTALIVLKDRGSWRVQELDSTIQ